MKLEYIKVRGNVPTSNEHFSELYLQEIGFTHMRILEGVATIIQLAGLLARLCKIVSCR